MSFDIGGVLASVGGMFHPDFHVWFDSHWRTHITHHADMDPLHAGEPLPQMCGVYFLWGDDMRLSYVGQAVDINQRLMMHRRYGKQHFAASAIEVQPAALHAVECSYIEALAPPLNAKYPASHWRGHAEMVRAIQDLWGPDTRPNDGIKLTPRR